MKIDEGKGLVEIPSIRTQGQVQITEQDQYYEQVSSPEIRATQNDVDSDEEEDPEKLAEYKHQLLEWVTKADFTGELNLAELANHKFRIDPDEAA